MTRTKKHEAKPTWNLGGYTLAATAKNHSNDVTQLFYFITVFKKIPLFSEIN